MAESAAKGRRAAVAFIFVTVTLDIVANGVIGPLWPFLVKGFLGGSTSRSSVAFVAFATVFAVMQLISAPILGSLSDRFGRRPVILISCAGLAADYVIMALAPSLGWLFVGRVIAGIASASMATSSAYIADITPPEKRAAAFGVLSAAFGVGFILGPLLGGALGQIGVRMPFWAAAGLTFANAAYGWFVLPESLAPANRSPFSLKLANPLGALTFLAERPGLIGLSAVGFLARLVNAVFAVVWALYAYDRYGWGPGMIAVSMAVVGVASTLVSVVVVRPTVSRLGERRTLVVGLLLGALGFALMGSATTGWMFLAAIFPLCLWGLAGPCIQSMMTSMVPPTEQGRLQGSNTGITSIAALVGPAVFGLPWAFASTRQHEAEGLTGLPYFLAGALMVLAAVTAWRATANKVLTQPQAAA